MSSTPERRLHPRQPLRPTVPVLVQGPMPFVHEGGVLVDLSSHGLGVLLPERNADLDAGDRVRLVIDWPGEEEALTVRGVIHDKDPSGRRLSIGLESPTREWDTDGLVKLSIHRRILERRLDPEVATPTCEAAPSEAASDPQPAPESVPEVGS